MVHAGITWGTAAEFFTMKAEVEPCLQAAAVSAAALPRTGCPCACLLYRCGQNYTADAEVLVQTLWGRFSLHPYVVLIRSRALHWDCAVQGSHCLLPGRGGQWSL